MQMVALIHPMSLILGSWFVLFLMFSGLGLIIQQIFKQSATTGYLWLDAFWLGWAFTLLILQLWHFVFPVNEVIFVILLFLSLISLIFHRRELLEIVRRFKHYRLFIVIFGIVILWLSNRAIDMPTAYDTGFRDIQAVMWMDTYPIVPGLNNLFSSLAFNQSVYLYDALLDVSIWSGRSYYIATGLLLSVFLAKAIWGTIQLYQHRDGQNMRWSWIFTTGLIVYVLFNTIKPGAITHFLTDTVVDLIGFLCVMYILDFIQFYRIEEEDSSNHYSIYKIAILILTGFTIKQSFIVFGLCLGLLVLGVWIRRGGLEAGIGRFLRIIAVVMLYAIILGIPFMARGVITSGYIAYPQSLGRFDVDWAESPELIAERQEMLATNTRIRYADPDEVLGSWDWVVPWFHDVARRLFEFLIPVGLSAILLVMYGIGRFWRREDKPNSRLGLWILLPMVGMIGIWFLTAPNIKYIQYILWINVSILILLVVLAWHPISWQWRVYSVFTVLGGGLFYIAYLVVSIGAFPLPAGPADGFYVRPMPPIKVIVTQTGAEINTPDSHINQCWDIPLPCTPIPHTRIYERIPGDLRHGFGLLSKE